MRSRKPKQPRHTSKACNASESATPPSSNVMNNQVSVSLPFLGDPLQLEISKGATIADAKMYLLRAGEFLPEVEYLSYNGHTEELKDEEPLFNGSHVYLRLCNRWNTSAGKNVPFDDLTAVNRIKDNNGKCVLLGNSVVTVQPPRTGISFIHCIASDLA